MAHPLQSSLSNVLTFCASYELRNFSRAARLLGVTPQAASRSVVRLEDTLGVSLFRRTTRTVTPTDAADVYYRKAKQALDLLRHAEQELSGSGGTGLVRVSAPSTFAHHLLIPALPAFRTASPGIEVELDVSNRNVDFTAEGCDFAVRLGRIAQRGFVTRSLGKAALGVFASPAYLARRSAPRTPDQLTQHICLTFLMPSTGRALPWTFAPAPRTWTPKTAVRCAGDPLATVSLARAGLGLVQTYDFVVALDIERGLLVEVLRDFRGMSRPFSIVFPESPKRSAAARTLIDFVATLRVA
jgi:DNA-binding transcriptional LysR family regulator